MPTIFLSYARQDKEPVKALGHHLRALADNVWLDEEISGGQIWWDQILAQIRSCDVFAYAMSPAALKSVACRRESEYAVALRKRILPICLTGDEPIKLLPPSLKTLEYVDYREPTPEASLRLARAFFSMLRDASLPPDPLPTPPDAPISYLNQLAAQVTGDAPLSSDQQNALLVNLQHSLTDPATAEDARELLTQLRRRRELLAMIAEVIDEVLGTTTLQAQVTVPKAHEEADHRDVETHPGQVFQDNLKSGGKGPHMVHIPAGSFVMGSPPTEQGRQKNESPQHTVTISRPFALSLYEITFAEYDAFAKATARQRPHDRGWGRGQRPVINVSWEDATAYAAWLSDQTGQRYRLPTEAEWEYAARVGSITAYNFGDDPAQLDEYACYKGKPDRKTQPVGRLQPNAWGLYDMHGNVWEWVQDWYDDYSAAAVADPAGPAAGSSRVLRGGGWNSSARDCRSAARRGDHPGIRDSALGLRLVREVR